MPDREERARQAAKHIAFVNRAFADETAQTIETAKVYEYGDGRELELPQPQFECTATRVTRRFATEAVFSAQGHIAVIDAGAFTKPGGNYEDGAFGPEQVLCSESNLYPVLCGLKKAYYDPNRGWTSGAVYNDRALYLHDVQFSHRNAQSKADVVVISPPDRKRALENNRSAEACDQALAFAIETMFRVCAAHGATTVICPAFGCGPQGNPEQQVIELVSAWLNRHPGMFEQVIFAVPQRSYPAFQAAFGHEGPKQEETIAESAQDEDAEDEDWRHIELPEGITLR